MKEAVLQTQAARRPSHSPLDESDWSALWKLPLQDRLKLLLWKIASEALPVRVLSYRLRSSTDTSFPDCANCKGQMDSIIHIFYICSVARTLWRASSWPMDLSIVPASSPANWILTLLHADTTLGVKPSVLPLFLMHAAILCDVHWFSRNKVSDDNAEFSFSDLQSSLVKRNSEHKAAWLYRYPSLLVSLAPHQPGWLKINFDVVFCHDGW